ncbi:YbaB/EbfC family nucleoid-associated protein [Desulfotomaculum sp. 1211_IL3151]|uniref:YbaB/EbfC family nucleoid-associated protein n=1 Tax=Desulfotomaculum sp. 1211_IL3151 TaxID=3084055 RepID=UPI002FD88998
MFGNLGGMLSQVQNMQDGLKQIQVEAMVGEGDVTVVMNGSQQLISVKISPEIMKENVTKLEDLVVEGIKLAQQDSRNKVQEEVAKMTGLNIGNFINMFKG